MDDANPNLAWLERPGGGDFGLRGNCSIGRATTNEIVLQGEKVSRRHAIIHLQGNGEYWLVDLGSSNGTYLDGRRVSQPCQLHDRARIEIGSFHLVFRRASAPDDPSPDSATDLATRTKMEVKAVACWLLMADIVSSTMLVKSTPAGELAVSTGRWLAECKETVEQCGGVINKFLGDGFLAYWRDHETAAGGVARAVRALQRLQADDNPRFRMAIHEGLVYMGGASLGEESLQGGEVNFLFRMEKLAAGLGASCLLSEPARDRIIPLLEPVEAGRHSLPGFDGQFLFFELPANPLPVPLNS